MAITESPDIYIYTYIQKFSSLKRRMAQPKKEIVYLEFFEVGKKKSSYRLCRGLWTLMDVTVNGAYSKIEWGIKTLSIPTEETTGFYTRGNVDTLGGTGGLRKERR